MWLLRRACHKIIWVNPLAGDERYQPLAGGMRAALPSVETFLSGHTLAVLEELVGILGDSGRPWAQTSAGRSRNA